MRARDVLCLAAALLSGCAAQKDAGEPAPAGDQGPAQSQQSQTAPRRPDGSYVLATIPTSSAGSTVVELVLPACGTSACAQRVRLVDGVTVLDSAAVDWESIVATPQRSEQSAGIMGVGDPLEQGRTLATWVTGDGEDAIATFARPVAIAPGSTALLVHQSGGAEHVKRLHYLFVADGRRLIPAWRGWEGQGLTNSSVDTMDVDADGRPELLFWRFALTDSLVSDWQLSVHRWNTARGKVEEVPASAGTPTVYATVAATFPGAGAATQFLVDHPECRGSFVVARSPERGTSGFAAVALTARRSLAAQAARECPAGGGARVVNLGARRR